MSRPVVSADDVRAAARRGELSLAVPVDAIVTPLARDEASRRGIDLVEDGGGEAGAPAYGHGGVASPRSATCDPDDVERIVERVRARAPGADSAQVREIARRLLERLGP